MPCRLTVNVREFTLTDEHATEVSDDVLTAVRAGGGYVHVVPVAGPAADVLITASTMVSFERITAIRPVLVQPDTPWPDGEWPHDYS